MIKTNYLWAISLAGFFFLVSCSNKPKEILKTKTLFTEISKEDSNLVFENTLVQTKENNHMINSQFISGGGVAVGDINNDGLQDIFLPVIK